VTGVGPSARLRAAQAARRGLPWLVGLLAVAAIFMAVRTLESSADGLEIRTLRRGSTPVTVFAPARLSAPAPVVLIAHGFAGSQQLMQPFALTLARSGFVAITFDFPGHGRNAMPMKGGLVDAEQSLRTLLESMEQMGEFAHARAAEHGGDGRYAVLGHSMASDIVVRHAQAHADVTATVGISLFAPSIVAETAGDSPRNLLVIAGALEPAMMAREALRVVGRVAGAGPQLERSYGRFDAGTARRATLSPDVEHIGVLYSPHTLEETLAWLDAAFGRVPAARPFIDARGPWLGLLLAGVVALAWPLARLLPRVSRLPRAARADAVPRQRLRWWRWRGQAPLTVLPALLTPLLLWKLPSHALPLLLGDYLVLHFALYGLLTLGGLWALGRRPSRIDRAQAMALGLAILAVAAYGLLAVGVPLDRYVFNLRPVAVRLALVLALCAGTLPYFLADEWLTRGAVAAPGAYLVSKILFLLSLVLAIALNPARLFFLAIIVPAILLLFVIYGLFSRWVFQQTGHPAVAAVANALAFGGFIAVTFPLVE
jgi:dienelactone hydrolase